MLPELTLVGLHAGWHVTPTVSLRAGVDNAIDLRLADQPPLFGCAELPRTWRLALRTHW